MKKNFNVLDLFAGAGGFSKGFEQEKFKILFANEINSNIIETYKHNHSSTKMFNLDIKEFAENLHDYIGNDLKKINIVIGGPPCQGFSMAGARIRNGFLEDERNYLFKHYFKIIQQIEPDYFLMENVEGLLSMNDGEIINEIENLFEDEKNFSNGRYFLTKRVFSMEEYGVPQRRRRLVIIGRKKHSLDLDSAISILKKQDNSFFSRVSIRDAISDLNFLESSEGNQRQNYILPSCSEYQKLRRKENVDLYNHIATKHSEIALERIKKIKVGENWQTLDENIKSVHSGAYGRMNWNDLAMTITTRFDTPAGGRFIHPERNRTITSREAARLQGFDDDFIFIGNKSSVNTQIGNAVPPIFAKFLARLIKNDIKKNN